MNALKRFTRHLTGVLFTLTLGDVFDWGSSVPEGDRPRYGSRSESSASAESAGHETWEGKRRVDA